jgi:hypothetical protein
LTWGELEQVAAEQGMDLFGELTNVLRHMRDGQRHLLLIGFPIPELVGGPYARIHWQALQLPILSTVEGNHGFRPTNESAMRRDLGTVMVGQNKICWIESKNWDKDFWNSRSKASLLMGRRLTVIGTGAIGSAVAEIMVRSGVDNVVLIDGDTIEPGNMVRHTLTLADEGKNKAIAVAQRLNMISPHASVQAIPSYLDPNDARCRSAIENADLVIDCTANDSVLGRMHEFSWKDSSILSSVFIGLQCERIYLYVSRGWSFSYETFQRTINPLVEQDYAAHPGFVLPRENLGCWHPVFPARPEDVWLMTSLGLKELEEILRVEPTSLQLRLITYDGALRKETIIPV